jgi:hypothetical protein
VTANCPRRDRRAIENSIDSAIKCFDLVLGNKFGRTFDEEARYLQILTEMHKTVQRVLATPFGRNEFQENPYEVRAIC